MKGTRACSFQTQLKWQLIFRVCWRPQAEHKQQRPRAARSSSSGADVHRTQADVELLTGRGRGWRCLWWGRSETDCDPECRASARPRRRRAAETRRGQSQKISLTFIINHSKCTKVNLFLFIWKKPQPNISVYVWIKVRVGITWPTNWNLIGQRVCLILFMLHPRRPVSSEYHNIICCITGRFVTMSPTTDLCLSNVTQWRRCENVQA